MSTLMGQICDQYYILKKWLRRSEINFRGICTESGILNIATIEHHSTGGEATCTFNFQQTFLRASYLWDAVLEL